MLAAIVGALPPRGGAATNDDATGGGAAALRHGRHRGGREPPAASPGLGSRVGGADLVLEIERALLWPATCQVVRLGVAWPLARRAKPRAVARSYGERPEVKGEGRAVEEARLRLGLSPRISESASREGGHMQRVGT